MALVLLSPPTVDAVTRLRVLRNLVPYSEDATQWTNYGCSVSGPLGLNALGKFAGHEISSGGATWHGSAVMSLPVHAGDVFVATLFLRTGTSNSLRVTVRYTDDSTTHHHLVGTPGSLPNSSSSIERISETLQSDGLTYQATLRITVPRASEMQFRVGPNSNVPGENITMLAAQLEAGSSATAYQSTP